MVWKKKNEDGERGDRLMFFLSVGQQRPPGGEM